MLTQCMVLEAYTPQLHLGDWQIVICVNRRKNLIAIERRHSSESELETAAGADQTIRIKTGIRAFRRQMPILANAMDNVSLLGLSVEEVVEAVFEVLAVVYQGAEVDFADFLQQRKLEVLVTLSTVKH